MAGVWFSAAATACAQECGEGVAAVDCGCGVGVAEAPAPFTLDKWLGLAESEYYIQGHIQQGLNSNSRSPGNPPGGFGNSPAAGLVYRADDYLLNQLYISVGDAVDTSKRSFDIGYQMDLVYGTDYVFMQSLGLEKERDGTNRWNGDMGSGFGGVQRYGLAMPQLFAVMAYEETRLIVGHFYNMLGHEAEIPTVNFYYTSNYPLFFNGYGESVPVTGALVQTQLADHWILAGGVHRGQGKWEDNNNRVNGFGSVEWTSVAKNFVASYTFDVGSEDDAGDNSVYAQSVIFEWQISPTWGYVLNTSYGFEEGIGPGGDTAHWYGLANYLAHTLHEKVVLGVRYDLFDDVDGARVFPRSGAPAFAPGVYHAITLGANYLATPNVTLRPEARWDWFAPDGALPPGPFDNLTERAQFLAAVDLLVTF